MLVVNGKNFTEKVLQEEKLTIVDFWSSTCMPCRVYSLVIDKIADLFKDKICVYKVNVEKEPELAIKYNIMSIPLTIFFKGGKEIDRLIGVIQQPVLEDKICVILSE